MLQSLLACAAPTLDEGPFDAVVVVERYNEGWTLEGDEWVPTGLTGLASARLYPRPVGTGVEPALFAEEDDCGLEQVYPERAEDGPASVEVWIGGAPVTLERDGTVYVAPELGELEVGARVGLDPETGVAVPEAVELDAASAEAALSWDGATELELAWTAGGGGVLSLGYGDAECRVADDGASTAEAVDEEPWALRFARMDGVSLDSELGHTLVVVASSTLWYLDDEGDTVDDM